MIDPTPQDFISELQKLHEKLPENPKKIEMSKPSKYFPRSSNQENQKILIEKQKRKVYRTNSSSKLKRYEQEICASRQAQKCENPSKSKTLSFTSSQNSKAEQSSPIPRGSLK